MNADLLYLIELVASWVGAIAAICGGLWTVYRVMLRRHINKLRSFIGNVDQLGSQLTKLANKLDAMDRRLGRMELELQPNGGSSIRDAIERIENSLLLVTQSADYMLTDAGVASFKANPEGDLITVNRGFAALLQRTPDELTGNGWRNFLADDEQLIVSDRWERAVDEQRDFSAYVNFQQLDGHTIRCRIQAYALRNRSGEYVGHQGFVRLADGPAVH